MNILFFLRPKSEVAFVYDHSTLRQVLETMEYHKYACIPMLNKAGEYVGTITEGDLLWGIKKYTDLNLKKAENIFIQDFPRKVDYAPVSVGSDMEDLIRKSMDQNFVPVIDDQRKFIGIVTRKSIIEYCYEKLKNLPESY
nr:CBS domain-containing protein [uncultured Mediterraneibacter sp.]